MRVRILIAGMIVYSIATVALAQQVPIPTTATEVPSLAPGPMGKAYVQMVGRMAHLWSWPLV